MEMICANAFVQEEDELKPIICRLTSKRCVCCTCRHPKVGFQMNPWQKDCPGFQEESEA